MKSENQIIVRCKQPIKIEKPLQCLLSFCSVFIFSMPSKLVIIIVIQFMFLGINIFWGLLRAHFNLHLTARAKMNLSRAQNIFMPANINSSV